PDGRRPRPAAGWPRPAFVVGRDTRWSGPMLQAALAAGLTAEGADVVDVGVLPTPAVAAVAADRGLPAAVISASHNPYADNGVKLFAPGGRKLAATEEDRIEAQLALGSPTAPSRSGDALGRVAFDAGAREWYCARVVAAIEGRRLDGLRMVLDCANGAASSTAPAIFASAGADVVEVLAASPDGVNINAACGSTDPSALSRAVVEHGADAGLALDGDADRVIAVDGCGDAVDGDHLLALFATDLQHQGRLAGSTVVVTAMTNLGFRLAMAAAGVEVHETPVGDRHVLEALDANGWSLGGEQSGHIIFRDLATTGDGALSGLLLLDLIARSGRTLAELAPQAMTRLPQVLRNVSAARPQELAGADAVAQEVRALEAALADRGRVLLRPSGTEPVVRIMVEAPTYEAASEAADRLVAAVLRARDDLRLPWVP
ncbi:MAG: phosphoglucosamine mutase, partial [Acidimicrobiales bacterium]